MMKLPIRKLIIPLLLILLLGGLAFTLLDKTVAPDITITTISGEKLDLKKMRGKTVLVNFWATSCPGCVTEMPQLVESYQLYHGKGFEIVAVAMSYDPPDHVVNYAKQHALPFSVALDADEGISRAFGDVQLTPTTFVIDKQGKIVRHIVGEIDFKALRTYLDKEL